VKKVVVSKFEDFVMDGIKPFDNEKFRDHSLVNLLLILKDLDFIDKL
jgi:hypothetical protein